MTKPLSKMHQRVQATPQERALLDTQEHQRKHEEALKLVEQAQLIPPNTYWDDAQRAYIEINDGLNRANEQLAGQILRAMEPQNKPHIKDEALVSRNLDLVTKDILACRQQLDDIYQRHADKKGGATTAEELQQVLEINDLYGAALNMYNGNVLPVIAYIFELLNLDAAAAQKALDEQAIMADQVESVVVNHDSLTDPNVISDVQPKQPNNV